MKVRALDTDHDWTFGKGLASYKIDNDAVSQSIDTRLRCFLGDCFFQTDFGIDWFNYLGSKNITGLKLKIRDMILNTDSVQTLNELSVSVNSARQLAVSYQVTTDFSTQVGGTVVYA